MSFKIKVYDLNALPKDAEVFTGKMPDFDPLDENETYQVEVFKLELRDNPYYKPEENGSKYRFTIELAVLNEGDFYGRRLWVDTAPSLKPLTKRGAGGPTILHKLVQVCTGKELSWDECTEYGRDLKTLYENLNKDLLHHQIKVDVENVKDEATGKVKKSRVKTFKVAKAQLPPFDAEKSKAIGEAKRAALSN